MKTRDEQIKEAAALSAIPEIFIAGAHWADENPPSPEIIPWQTAVVSSTQMSNFYDRGYERGKESLKEKLAVAVEALEWIMPKVHQGNHEGELSSCPKATCVEFRNALEKIK